MSKKYKIIFSVLLLIAVMWLSFLFVDLNKLAVLNPKGFIALKEFRLIVISTFMMLIVVVPVFIMTVFFAWKYHADNTKSKYRPDEDQNHLAEIIWWGVPFIIIGVLGVITWKSCIELDPFKPLQMNNKPLKIQVVALQWKWLFIYPEQKIATVNFFQFPEQTPINFEITADAPMNSFWIPELGGQIYAMPGMSSKLHLIADREGDFRGSSSNLSGTGFSGMVFTAKASSEADFNAWVESVKQSDQVLDYSKVVEPSSYVPQAFYLLAEDGLYDQIVMKYMMPQIRK
jgi:cytochrome o ubiquinol oxidase subunit II